MIWTCINEQGEVNIPINKEGLPSATAVFPTVTHKPEDRLSAIEAQLDFLCLKGYWVEGWKWIKNPAFDKRGQKTTAEIRFRICKDADEALVVAEKIKTILTIITNQIEKENEHGT